MSINKVNCADSAEMENPLLPASNVEMKNMTKSTSNSVIEVGQSLQRSYSKWDPKQQGSTLVWRDVCVYAKCPKKGSKTFLKRIINNSTGAIQAGTLMALMGSR